MLQKTSSQVALGEGPLGSPLPSLAAWSFFFLWCTLRKFKFYFELDLLRQESGV